MSHGACGSLDRVYSLAQVEQHNSADDLWVIIDGIIYDHPGGKAIIKDFAGQDATEAFADIGHSSDAREILKTLQVGRLESKKTAKRSLFLYGSISIVVSMAILAYIAHKLLR